jgi:hypothetical protein
LRIRRYVGFQLPLHYESNAAQSRAAFLLLSSADARTPSAAKVKVA